MSEAKFDKAVAIVQALPKDGGIQPSDDDRLQFYAYYKQATVGDVNTARPGILDFVGKAKWDAWEKVKETTKEDAKAKYVEKLLEVRLRYDPDALGEATKYTEELEAA
ncbi:hypothetical protein BS47DRAFT_1373350 [Hydnum rufescens UP504]|uniref:ACB domain-containing protein n=1 Tax=Hydnum rufescens UP504 TaxID=1448309 RepID=A0A9P6AQY4_9AGAM|nr:hypothetical protein BS47DRAFT_1373350 [Hydnum rufescens UP504]